MIQGRSDDKMHPDYVPSMFSLVKSPEEHQAKRLWQLEKYNLVQNMKPKRLRELSTSDKENVSTVEIDEQYIDRGTQTDTLDVSDKGCQTEESTFQDVGCQTEDVKVWLVKQPDIFMKYPLQLKHFSYLLSLIKATAIYLPKFAFITAYYARICYSYCSILPSTHKPKFERI